MKRLIFPLCILLMLACAGCKDLEREISISAATMQNVVAKQFPFEKGLIGANFKLHSPQVFFQGNSIGLSLQYSAGLLLNTITGEVAFACKPVYRPEKSSFYMTDFIITRLTFNNTDSLENTPIVAMISTAVGALFADYPLYALNQNDFRANLSKMMLKSVSVKDNRLVLQLGL